MNAKLKTGRRKGPIYAGLAAAALLAGAVPAFGAEGYLIRLYYDGRPERLNDISFLPYAAYDDSALGEVSVGYSRELAARGFRFDVLAEDPAANAVWQVDLPLAALPPSATVAYTRGPDRYIVITPPGTSLSPTSHAVRLWPHAVNFAARGTTRPRLTFAAQDEVAAIVAAVDGDAYRETVGDLAAFGTRYSYSARAPEAATYIADAFKNAGLEAERDRFFSSDITAVAASTENVAWGGGRDGLVIRTGDGGATWNVVANVENQINDVACAGTSVAWLGTSGGQVYRTTDRGRSWEESDLGPGRVNDLFFLDGAHGWAVTSTGDVYATPYGGSRWELLTNVNAWLRAVAFADAQHGVAVGSDGYLARTDDGGLNWQRLAVAPAVRLEAVAYRTPNEVYVVGEGGTVLRSTDAGATWAPLDLHTGIYFQDVGFVNGTGYLVGQGGGIRKTDDGFHWSVVATTPYLLFSVAPPSPDVVWCGPDGHSILHTADGGYQWEDQAENADDASPYVWENVWARQPGAGGEAVVVCGHYDSIAHGSTPEDPEAPAPGADDNGTGTAAVIAFARASQGHNFRRDVIYACFAGEEEGLYGSSHFAHKLALEGEPVLAVVNMDMLGYADKTPEEAEVIANEASAWLAEYERRAAAAYVPELPARITVDDWMIYSDHSSFWNVGYAASLLIEDWPVANPYAHTAGDTPATVNFDLALAMTRGGAAAAASLAAPSTMPVDGDLSRLEVYPNPYKFGQHHGRVYFNHVPARSSVRFYNLAGEVVAKATTGAGPLWAYEIEAGAAALHASGVYLFVVETASGERKTGKLAVLR